MWRKYKPFLQTDDFTEKIITIITVAVVPPCITATERDYIALYVIGKDVTYKNILKRNKKSLKLNLGPLIETSLANLITNLRNNLINILQTTKITILI